MTLFIRIDEKGHWRGSEHVSSLNGLADEWNSNNFENGISCYSLENVSEGIENLRQYWFNIAMNQTLTDYKNMQVTIFEGEKVGEGSDYEDISTCEKTIIELDAEPFMKKVFEVYEQFEDEEVTEEEYFCKLENILQMEEIKRHMNN